MLAAALLMAGCGGSGGGPPSTEAPTVVSTIPFAGDSSAPATNRISATFSRPMDPSSLNAASFKASTVNGPLVGTVTYTGNTATLRFGAQMPKNTVVNARITTAAKDLAGKPLANDYLWSFTTDGSNDTTAPTVSSTDPADGATGVVTNKAITAVFSEPMAEETVDTTTFKLHITGAGPESSVAGTVTLENNVATFKPTADLEARTSYTARITTGVKDLSDNSLAEDKTWTFTTGTNTDTTPPKVSATDPAADATGVSINKSVSVTFNDAMDAASLNANTFMLRRGNSPPVAARYSYANKVAILDPNTQLDANAVYTVTVSIAVKDSAGNHLENAEVWSFTTAGSSDSTPPTIRSTRPADNATNVFLNQSINATFSEEMLATSINTTTFSIAGVTGSVTYDTGSKIATFKPSVDLLPNTTYTARMDTGVKDAAGNRMSAPLTWSFTTGVQRAQTRLDLGAATTYAVLAGSTVTNGGPTIVNGDLGVSPGSAVTGFPPGKVNGAIHAGDANAAQAKADLLAGQLDAAGRLGGQTLPGDLSGLTFTPGLYRNSSTVMLSSGSVTLDAQGDPDAVFIFQMATTLTTSTGTQVVLAGGAKASNVYWSVGSSATLGVNSIFKGIILAEVSITVNNGAVNDGTFLTKVGAITLQSNSVTRGPRN